MRTFMRAIPMAICMLLALATGCSPFVGNNMVEEIAPVILWSVADGGGGKLQISTIVPPLIKEKKQLLSMEVDLLKQGGKKFNLVYYRELKAGQLRMMFISEELAKKGIVTIISTLLMDPDISQRLYVVIVKGSVEDYFSNQINKQANIDYFLYRMFKHYERNNQGEMSIVNLHQFKNKMYAPYIDPILPVFLVNQNEFIYEGTALFRHDKMISSVNDIEDQIFQLIDNDHYLKLLTMPDLSVTLGNVRAAIDMKLDPTYSSLALQVKLSGRIDEYRGNRNLHDEDELMRLNQEMEVYLEEHTSELLANMQQWQVSPLEIGTYTLHPFTKPISEEDWLQLWKDLSISVDYDLKIEPMVKVNK